MTRKVIPDYARDYRSEYLFIIGIDKCFKFFWDNTCKADKGVFQNHRVDIIKNHINKLEKAQRLGNLSDISNIEIDEQDVFYSSSLLEKLNDFTDYYVDYDDWEFDEERFDRFVDLEFPGYKNLVACIELFYSKFKIDKHKLISINLFGMIVIVIVVVMMMMELIVMILRIY